MMRYRYWQDGYGNQFRWEIAKQSDGKYHGCIWNVRSKRYTRRMKYNSKKVLKKYLWRAYLKSQDKFRNAKEWKDKKKEYKDRLKPSKSELKNIKLKKDLANAKLSIKKHERKIKLSNSWVKKYEKRIKMIKKKLEANK